MIPIIVVIDGIPGAGITGVCGLLNEKCRANGIKTNTRSIVNSDVSQMLKEVLVRAPDGEITIFDHFHYEYALRAMIKKSAKIPAIINDYFDICAALIHYAPIQAMLFVSYEAAISRSSKEWFCGIDAKTLSRFVKFLPISEEETYHNPTLKEQSWIVSALFDQIKERIKQNENWLS